MLVVFKVDVVMAGGYEEWHCDTIGQEVWRHVVSLAACDNFFTTAMLTKINPLFGRCIAESCTRR
jgi:hypothetical protein